MSAQPPASQRRLQTVASDVPATIVIVAGFVWTVCAVLWLVTGRQEPELMGLCLTTICGTLLQQGVSALRDSRSSPEVPPDPQNPALPPVPVDPDPAA